MKTIPLAHISWLEPFVTWLQKSGSELSPYLAVANIERSLLENGDGWISKRQLYAFLNAAASGERMPELGFLVGEQLKADTPGPLWDLMSAERTFAGFLRVLCRELPRANEDNRAWLEEGKDGEVWLLHTTGSGKLDERRIADHAGLGYFANIVRLVAGTDWSPERARLQTGPTTAYSVIPTFRDCGFAFDCEASGIAFPASFLNRELPQYATLHGRTPHARLLATDETFSVKLTRLLHDIVCVGGLAPSIKVAASITGSSPRTINRRLAEESTTYRTIVDGLRMERAVEFLACADTPIKQVAFELGFSGPNNFNAYFRRMTGTTPGKYRKRLIAGDGS